MQSQTLFDSEHQLRRTRACQEFLRRFLSDVDNMTVPKKALDVACGVGLLSRSLSDAGLDVTAVDARPENIAEARRRFPDLKFHLVDVETNKLTKLGRFHITICFGLLYHLENPFQVVRSLFEVTDEILLIESQITPGETPTALLMNEPGGEDKALKGIAFVPTENCLVKMCYQAGFGEVYTLKNPPGNKYFRNTLRRRKQRTVLVAVKHSATLKGGVKLIKVPEPQTTRPDLWSRVPRRVTKMVRYIQGR